MNVFNCFKVGVNFITSGELCNSKLKDKKTFTHKNLCDGLQCEPHFMSQVKITLLESSNIKSYLRIAFGKNSGLWL